MHSQSIVLCPCCANPFIPIPSQSGRSVTRYCSPECVESVHSPVLADRFWPHIHRLEIRALAAVGWTTAAIARHIGVTETAIRNVRQGKTWRHIT